MADELFSQAEPQEAPQENGVDRRDDIQKAAEAGRMQSEKEAAQKNALKQAKIDALQKDQEAMKTKLAEEQLEREKKKQFRSFKKQQEREIAADKLRREKEAALVLEGKKVRDAKREVQQKYMDEIHENAQVKLLKEKRERKLKDDLEQERAQAEREYRRKVDEAERLCAAKKQQAEKDTRVKKSNEQSALKERLYAEETRVRSKLAALEQEKRRQEQMPARSAVERQRALMTLEPQMRIKKKKIEDEHQEKKDALVRESRHRETELETAMHSEKAQAESDLKVSLRSFESEKTRRINEAEMTYKKRLGESRG